MPAASGNRPKQLRRLQPAVGQHQHLPVGRQRGLESLEQVVPQRVPGPRLVARADGPGHGDAAAMLHDADGQNVKAAAQVGDIQGQYQALRGPAVGEPAQQRHETRGRVEVAAVGTGLGLLGLVELAEALANGVVGAAHERSQGQGDGVEATGMSQHEAEGPQGQDEGDRLGQVGHVSGQSVGPGIELGRAGHEESPQLKE